MRVEVRPLVTVALVLANCTEQPPSEDAAGSGSLTGGSGATSGGAAAGGADSGAHGASDDSAGGGGAAAGKGGAGSGGSGGGAAAPGAPCWVADGDPAPPGAPCPDGDACNGAETCDGAGVCVAGAPPAVDDANPCTADACDPALGVTHASCAPLDLTTPTTLADALAFLWSGPDSVQTGVAPGAIDLRRAAAIRGLVRGPDGAPLPEVAISIQDHPEYGSTQTFADGAFAMAVSGGGPLVVSYRADGYLPVARQIEVPWQDYTHAPAVVLTQL